MSGGVWGRRRRYVYAYDVLDLRNFPHPVRVGYVGKSSWHPLQFRDPQHRNSKDWAWAIRGPVRIVWEGDCGRVALWLREVWYIRKLRPLFNVEWNTANPARIPPWLARKLYGRPQSRAATANRQGRRMRG